MQGVDATPMDNIDNFFTHWRMTRAMHAADQLWWQGEHLLQLQPSGHDLPDLWHELYLTNSRMSSCNSEDGRVGNSIIRFSIESIVFCDRKIDSIMKKIE